MLVDAYKNNNSTSKNYGQVYPRVFKRDGLNLKGFAKHISEHGSLVKYDLAVLVLQNIVECLKEMMIQGVPVKLDGLGIFSPGIQGTGVNTLEQFDPQSQVKGIRINFRPESAGDEEDKLSKTALKKLAVFKANDLVVTKYKMVGGKKKRYNERTPLSTYGIATAEEDPEPEP
jgi:predicted histone-like DNA-binding protein